MQVPGGGAGGLKGAPGSAATERSKPAGRYEEPGTREKKRKGASERQPTGLKWAKVECAKGTDMAPQSTWDWGRNRQ